MNPLTNVRNITKLNEREISLGVSEKTSWHAEYKDSAWIFIGGLDFELTEGDILCVFSQYGEIVNVNLIRDKKTGKSKGYCFLCYEDQRSTNLAVDNFNGIKLSGRTTRVDHVANYRIPKDDKNSDLETKLLRDVGCAPKVQRQIEAIIKREGESTDEIIEVGRFVKDDREMNRSSNRDGNDATSRTTKRQESKKDRDRFESYKRDKDSRNKDSRNKQSFSDEDVERHKTSKKSKHSDSDYRPRRR